VFTKPEKRAANKLFYDNILYSAKITIKTYPVSLPRRLDAFFILETGIVLIYFLYRQLFSKK